MTLPSDMPIRRVDPAYKRDIDRARAEGVAEGRSAARKEIVDHLQKMYLDPKVERGSDRGSAILEVTREICNFIRPKR